MTAATTDPNLQRLREIEAQIASGDLTAAAHSLRTFQHAAPNDVRGYLVAAKLAQTTGDVTAEVQALQHARGLTPRWSAPHLELAKTLSRLHRHEEAQAAVAQAVALAPDNLAALEVAVAVANNARDPTTAAMHLRSALALRPDDLSIRRALALTLTKQQLCAEAELHWLMLLKHDADDVVALRGLANCMITVQRNAEALQLLQRAREIAGSDPNLEFHLALARGETPPLQPVEMVRSLFDDYAQRFDKHLVGDLKYHVPQRVAQLISARAQAMDVLDIGCGTGLLGVYLGIARFSGSLIGIDLSQKMLEQASQHSVYRELRCADLREELAQAALESFDVITANDVFIYVGDLSQVIPAAFRALRRGGALMFSCETAAESEGALVLRPSRRYAHALSAIERLCREAGFSDVAFEHVDLRHDAQQPTAGFIAVAEKP